MSHHEVLEHLRKRVESVLEDLEQVPDDPKRLGEATAKTMHLRTDLLELERVQRLVDQLVARYEARKAAA